MTFLIRDVHTAPQGAECPQTPGRQATAQFPGRYLTTF